MISHKPDPLYLEAYRANELSLFCQQIARMQPAAGCARRGVGGGARGLGRASDETESEGGGEGRGEEAEAAARGHGAAPEGTGGLAAGRVDALMRVRGAATTLGLVR